MARLTTKAIQQYRGTTDQHQAYTGPIGEITVDTTKKTAVVQDGATPGGHPLAKEAVKLKAADDMLTINGGTEATHAGDITIALSLAQMVSGDANNGLKTGGDGKLFASAPDAGLIIAADDKVLTDVDGKLGTTLSLEFAELTGVLSLKGKDGAVVGTATIPTAYSLLQDTELVTEDAEGTQGHFLRMTFEVTAGETQTVYVDLAPLSDVYTAGTGLALTGKEFSVKVDPDGGLTVGAAGVAVDPEKLLSAAVSSDAGNAIVAGTDKKLLVKVVSSNAGNIIKTGTDKGALLTATELNPVIDARIAERIDSEDAPLACAMVSPKEGNLLQCVDGKLMVYADYGTM